MSPSAAHFLLGASGKSTKGVGRSSGRALNPLPVASAVSPGPSFALQRTAVAWGCQTSGSLALPYACAGSGCVGRSRMQPGRTYLRNRSVSSNTCSGHQSLSSWATTQRRASRPTLGCRTGRSAISHRTCSEQSGVVDAAAQFRKPSRIDNGRGTLLARRLQLSWSNTSSYGTQSTASSSG